MLAQGLIKDINTQPSAVSASGPAELVSFAGKLFFTAWEQNSGRELWMSDGTTAGTQLVRDIEFTETGTLATVSELTVVGASLYFVAPTSGLNPQLWVTDGTTAGTRVVPGLRTRYVFEALAFGNEVLFTAATGSSPKEVWRSDGTAAGTRKIAVFNSVYLRNVVGGLAYFVADDGVVGNELWATDGTLGGERLIGDLNPGSASSYPAFVFGVPSGIVFVANNGFWFSDGTPIGTRLVPGLPAGLPYSPAMMTLGNEVLFGFSGSLPADDGLWKTDGNTVQKLANVSSVKALVQLGGKVYFGSGTDLWGSDGTAAGTSIVLSLAKQISTVVATGGKLYLTAPDTMAYNELWEVDPVAGLATPLGGRNPLGVVAVGATVFFNGVYAPGGVSQGGELWKLENGIVSLVADIANKPQGSRPLMHGTLDGLALFTADDGVNGPEVWRSDGTDAGTFAVTNVPGNPIGFYGGFFPVDFGHWNGEALYAGLDPQNGIELWKTDGTPAGTGLLRDINPGPSHSSGILLAMELRALWYFAANDGVNGWELWVTDKTTAGTRLFMDVVPGPKSSKPNLAGVLKGRLIFMAENPAVGWDMWATDGTSTGTERLYANFAGIPTRFTVAGDLMFFTAADFTSGYELWRTDGTAAGTFMVQDIDPGAGSSIPYDYAVVDDDEVFFLASEPSTGLELWKSDGTNAGTTMIVDLTPGPTGSPMGGLLSSNGVVVFDMSAGPTGKELWRTDGTAAGTAMIRDINPGPLSGRPSPIGWSKPIGDSGVFLFNGVGDGAGVELWRTDGSSAGTFRVADLVPGALSAYPSEVIITPDIVYLVAQDRVVDTEPFAVPTETIAVSFSAPYGVGCPGARSATPVLDRSGLPAIGSSQFALAVTNARPSSPVTVLASLTSDDHPIGGGCSVLVGPVLALLPGTTNDLGRASIPLPIPSAPALVGLRLSFQAVVSDPFGFAGASYSNGLRVLIGV